MLFRSTVFTGPGHGAGASIRHVKLISPYEYVNSTTIRYPTVNFVNYSSYDFWFRGEETYEPLYTQWRMLATSVSPLSDYDLNLYLLKDSLGINQFFTVVDAANLPIEDVLITLSKWYGSFPSIRTTIAQCFSNPAGSCSIWLQPYAEYGWLKTKDGYATQDVPYTQFTGSPNPAYVYMSSGSSLNFTSVFDGISYALIPSGTYFAPNISGVPAGCQIIATDGNLNHMNFTILYYNNTIGNFTIYNNTYLDSVPSGATILTSITDNGRFTINCEYEWVSNATGSLQTYTNTATKTIWIYSDYLVNKGEQDYGQPLALIIAIVVVIIIAGGIALYNTGYGVVAGILLMCMFSYMGFIPWNFTALASLTAIALLILRNAI